MIARVLIFMAGCMLVAPIHAAESYGDYASFYAAQPNRLFGEPITQDRNTAYSSPGTEGVFTENQVTIGGRKAKITLGTSYFTLNGRRYPFKKAQAYPNERVSEIYPLSADIFTTGRDQKQSALCIEGYGSGSGEMDRYAQIYLLINPFSKPNERKFLHLPSLLSSCRAMLVDKQGKLIFPSNSYVFDAEHKHRIGLLVSYSTFQNGEFVPAQRESRLRFKTPDIPFQFTVE